MSTVSHDSETPAKGQQVITACAFIHQLIDGKEKVFLPIRAEIKKFLPGIYELPGGHIDFGEDIVSGLKREVKEEFGMEVSIGDPFYVFTYLNDIKGSHSIEVIYFAKFLEPIENIKLNPEDHKRYDWFDEDEVLSKVVNSKKGQDDPEIQGIVKGFSLLRGDIHNLG